MPLSITNLRCEYLHNPEGIDVLQPRLSWELTGEGRSLRQTAWQILAASTREALELGQADLWDSGKVASDETAHINYGGQPLESAAQVFWKVRVWDQDRQPSEWSSIAHWSLGLLGEADWGGDWIGLEGQLEPAYLRGANWIVYPADRATPPTVPVQRYYRRSFTLPEFPGREIKRVRFLYTGDQAANGHINGRELGSRNDHRRIKDQDITFRLLPGENVLTLTGSAPGGTVASGGVVGLVEVIFHEGPPFLLPTDASWKVAETEAPGWMEAGFDDSAWISALDVGSVGPEPWGEVRIAEDRRLPARYLRREFSLNAPIHRATLFACGLGFSEFFLNGERVGDHMLSPALSEYPKRTFYVTHDVTQLVRTGENALGAVLGNGRYFGPRSIVYASMPTFGFPKLRLHLRVEYEDSTVDTLVGDGSWKLTADGPIIANNDFDGEEYDARKELGDWTRVRFDDSAWQSVQIVPPAEGPIAAQMIEPIRITQRLRPISLTEPQPGVFVFDFGQNFVGWVRLQVAGAAGTVIRLRHAETLLPDGLPSTVNLRGAEATNTYILKGEGEETWEPCFTTQGFRFVELRGFPGQPSLETLEGCVVNDDLKVTGSFESSNALLNRIHENVSWGVRGNNKSIPMDCPQRDERQGWLGDRLEGARGEAYLFDNAAFYAKWLQDIRDTQRESGSISDIAPNHWPHFTDNVVWPSSAIIIPNTLFEQFGDAQAIEDAYESGKRWMDYMSQWVENGIIARDSFGDWCVPPEDPVLIHAKDPDRNTGKAILATTHFYNDARTMQRFAEKLGREADAVHFAALADSLLNGLNQQFFNPELARYDNGSQTSYILPLAFGMVPELERQRVFDGLVQNITEVTNSHVGTGIVGGQHLYRTLTKNGAADLAYRIATNETYPGYGYMISQGATTLWELWNGNTADPWMNSGNHVMLAGDVIIWLYAHLAGISPDPAVPGYKHVILKPHAAGDLSFLRASYHSIRGPIVSAWQRGENGEFEWQITLPPNTSATVYLPALDEPSVREGGKPLTDAMGIRFAGKEPGYVVCQIGSGEYRFSSR